MSFDAILSRVSSGESVSSSELLPFLCLERREQRAKVNMLLANAYWESGLEENRVHAKVFIQRAWLLSRFSPDLLPLFTKIHSTLDDIATIKGAYKQIGMAVASEGDVSEAIKYFDLWHYAYINFKNLDKYEYDFDIMGCMDRLAEPDRFSPVLRRGVLREGKIRLAYLVKGAAELGSVLIKINLLFARAHDRSRFEPMFFVPESERTVMESPEGPEYLRLFESHGYKVIMAPNGMTTKERLLAVARGIYEAGTDILITSAGLANFEHYYITALSPAPLTIGMIQGPPQQFAPPALNWSISWSKHWLMDCPVNCSLTDMEMELPVRSRLTPYARAEFELPEEAVIMLTAGRYVKFQEPGFWKAIIDLIKEHPQLYYVAMGVEEAQIPFLSPMLSDEIRSRIRFIGWRGDEYLRGLCLADILIDTFPSGGGVVLTDSMALGIPVVTFKNNYMKLYDQTDWSPAEEFIITPETVVERYDFAQLKRVVSRMVEDQEFRSLIAKRGQEHLLQTRGKPERAVRKCEDIYLRVLEEELSGKASTEEGGAEIEELAEQFRRPPRAEKDWVVWTARRLKQPLQFGERVLDRVVNWKLARRKS